MHGFIETGSEAGRPRARAISLDSFDRSPRLKLSRGEIRSVVFFFNYFFVLRNVEPPPRDSILRPAVTSMKIALG